jgi:lambda family phage portal protein
LIRATLLDKAIGVFSPQRALNRVKARTHLNFITGGGYSGASKKKTSLKGWKTAQGDSDSTDLPDLQVLRDRSFDLYRNNPLANGAIGTAEINIVGTGLKLQSQVDSKALGISQEAAEKLSEKIEKEFSLWAESKECDTSRTSNFYELQSIAFLSTLIGGDSVALLPSIKRHNTPYTLTIQLLESYRLSNKDNKPDSLTCAGGIETSSNGEPLKYHISKHHPFGLNTKKNTWLSVDTFGTASGRRQVVHLFDKNRPGQRRGVPFLAPVIESLKQLGRYTEAELTAAVISGLFTVFIKSELGEVGDGISSDDIDDIDYGMGNGSIVGLAPGESIDSANPGRPNQNFDPFTLSIIRQIGSSLQIPYELLIKHFTASYSASRGALLEAFKFFRKKRKWLSQNFCQLIYEEWLTEAVLNGRIEAPGFFDDEAIKKAYCKSAWNGDAPGQLDPVKETKAAKMRCEEGFSTRTKEAAEMNGTDFNSNMEKVKSERVKMIEAGLIIEEEKDGM